MSADKYPSVSPCQMEAIVYLLFFVYLLFIQIITRVAVIALEPRS